MQLCGNLHEAYKSFEKGFQFKLSGQLVLTSGVNGGGKSQLFEIIKIRKFDGTRGNIKAEITLDGQRVFPEQVSYRSFRQNIGVAQFRQTDPTIIQQSKQQVAQNFRQYRLDSKNQSIVDYSNCCRMAKNLLINFFGEDRYNDGNITDKEIIECPALDGFVWKTDDIFQNIVSETFYHFAKDELHNEAKAGREGKVVSKEKSNTPPWTEFNSLLEMLKVDYRFKNHFEISQGSFSLNEPPTLFQINKDGIIDTSQKRELNDLSDGEKAIISLAFGSIYSARSNDQRILLLDEFDATLNPSLTKVFFDVIQKYFISKGVMVVIATHSPSTIALAPSSSTFYEIFSKHKHVQRIIPVERYSYADLRLVNQQFVDKISNQASRVEHLKAEQTRLETLLNTKSKPVIYVEGPTDVKYLKKAFEIFGKPNFLDQIFIDLIGEETGKGTNNSNDAALKHAERFIRANSNRLTSQTIILHDPENKVKECDYDNFLFVRRMPKGSDSMLKKGIESLFTDELLVLAREQTDHFSVHTVGTEERKIEIRQDRKAEFCDWVISVAQDEHFVNFKPIVQAIEEIVSNNKT